MANLMDLVRELKTLNARKKAGEALSADEETRRKELKAYLKTALEQQGQSGGSTEDSAVRERSGVRPSGLTPVAAVAPAGSAPRPVPTPAPPQRPVAAAGSAPRPVPQPRAPVSFMPDASAPPPVASPSAPTPPPAFVPRKDAFAIRGADALIDAAASSEAVAKVDPMALMGRKATASTAEKSEAEAKADEALRANKRLPRATSPDEIAAQLEQAASQYTPSEDALTMEQYYGDYEGEGFRFVPPDVHVDLKPIDSRELELARLDATLGPAGGSSTLTVPSGLAFLDDFPVLYQKRLLPAPEDMVADSDDPNLIIPGKRKVTVHMLNGEKRQGAVRSMRRGDLGFRLEPLGSGHVEEISIGQVKALFIHMQANAQPPAVQGRALTVVFRDQRAVEGMSDDYAPGVPVFSLVPAQGRGQFERIIVNGTAVASIR